MPRFDSNRGSGHERRATFALARGSQQGVPTRSGSQTALAETAGASDGTALAATTRASQSVMVLQRRPKPHAPTLQCEPGRPRTPHPAWLRTNFNEETKTWTCTCELCAVCAGSPEAQDLKLRGGPWSRGEVELRRVRAWTITKHEQTPLHLLGMALMQGKQPDADTSGAHPTKAEWQQVLKDIWSGNPQSIKGSGNLGRRKTRCMQWCLAQARRNDMRAQLLDAQTIAISCDKRQTRFVLRFRCAGNDLIPRTGILAISREVGDVNCQGADKLRQAVLRGIRHAMESRSPPKYLCRQHGALAPHLAETAGRDVDKDFKTVLPKIELYAADGASDAQLAGRELASSLALAGPSVTELSDTLVQSLPGLKAARESIQGVVD